MFRNGKKRPLHIDTCDPSNASSRPVKRQTPTHLLCAGTEQVESMKVASNNTVTAAPKVIAPKLKSVGFFGKLVGKVKSAFGGSKQRQIREASTHIATLRQLQAARGSPPSTQCDNNQSPTIKGSWSKSPTNSPEPPHSKSQEEGTAVTAFSPPPTPTKSASAPISLAEDLSSSPAPEGVVALQQESSKLPASKPIAVQLDLEECLSSETEIAPESTTPEKQVSMSKRLRGHVKLLFSEETVQKLHSQAWKDRKAALVQMNEQVEESGMRLNCLSADKKQLVAADTIKLFSAGVGTVEMTLHDPVGPVLFATYSLLQSVLQLLAGMVPKVIGQEGLKPLMPLLLNKMSDCNKRSARSACKCLLQVARQQQLNGIQIILPHLKQEAIPLRPRLNLLQLLVSDFGYSKSTGLDVGLVMNVAIPALAIADDKTRQAAIAVIVSSYKANGRRTKKYLGQAQGTLKPVMTKIIHRKFAEIDGSSVSAEKGKGKGVRKSKRRKARNKLRNKLPRKHKLHSKELRPLGAIRQNLSPSERPLSLGGRVPLPSKHRLSQQKQEEDAQLHYSSSSSSLEEKCLSSIGSRSAGGHEDIMRPQKSFGQQPLRCDTRIYGIQEEQDALLSRLLRSPSALDGMSIISPLAKRTGGAPLSTFFDRDDENMMDMILANEVDIC